MHNYRLRSLLLSGAVFLSLLVSAQEEVVSSLTARPMPTVAQKAAAAGDTVNLPFIDDFSTGTNRPSPQKWQDSKVWVNRTLGVDVPTLGVASFDGLDESGLPYDASDAGSDTLADVLTSRYLNIPSAATNVYLSFFYQIGGLGEPPAQGDTLVVDFWNPTDSSWQRVWAKEPDTLEHFRQVLLPVDQPDWLKPGFRFRLGAYGARNGAFDVWNIDYVRLSANRSATDTVVTDPTFTRAHAPIVANFEQIPWFHLQAGMASLVPDFNLYYRKNGPAGSANINLRKYFIYQNGALVYNQNGNPYNTDPYNVENAVQVPLASFPFAPPAAPFELQITSVMDGANDGIRRNDTVSRVHTFDNYYAWDDGSAERAYGIKNLAGAQMAVQFTPLQADTLKGVYLNFAHAGVDAGLNSFRIGVWSIQGGIPDNLIYLSDSLYKPRYDGQDDLVAYALDTSGIYINGPVFIGLKQTSIQPLNLGLDLNNSGRVMYYGTPGDWYISLVEGHVMMRPYFRYQPADLETGEELAWEELKFGPNPFQTEFRFSIHEETNWRVLNLLGQPVVEGRSAGAVINTSGWRPGLYVLELREGPRVRHIKIIRR